MKPQDMLVLLKVFLWQSRKWTQRELAESLSMNLAEVNHSLKRLAEVKLFDPHDKFVLHRSALEFILHGLPFVFPGKLGPMKSGHPTAHAVLGDEILFDENDLYVWPDKNGEKRGHSVIPLHKGAAEASKKDPQLYQLLALIDVLRVGQAREKNIAKKRLTEALSAN